MQQAASLGLRAVRLREMTIFMASSTERFVVSSSTRTSLLSADSCGVTSFQALQAQLLLMGDSGTLLGALRACAGIVMAVTEDTPYATSLLTNPFVLARGRLSSARVDIVLDYGASGILW